MATTLPTSGDRAGGLTKLPLREQQTEVAGRTIALTSPTASGSAIASATIRSRRFKPASA
jgi:hypothetical protein